MTRKHRSGRGRPTLFVVTLVVIGLSALQVPNADAGPEPRLGSAAPEGDFVPGPVPELATATSNTVLEKDGSYTLEAHTLPVNYKDDGEWKPIDNELVPSPGSMYEVENAANSYSAQIPTDGSAAPVRFEIDDAWVTMRMHGLDDAPNVDGSAAVFDDVIGADEVVYEATATGLKESILLAAPPTATSPPIEYTYTVMASPDLTPVLTESGSIEFRSLDGIEIVVPRGSMVDSAAPQPAYSEDVTYALKKANPGWVVTVTPNAAWLADPTRVYPVAIDPTLTRPVQRDCWVGQENPTQSNCGNNAQHLRVGRKSSTQNYRSLIDFDTSSIPMNGVVSSASVSLYLDTAQSYSSTSANYALFSAGKAWDASATWNVSGTSGAWSSSPGDPGATAYGTLSLNGIGFSGYRTFTTGLKNLAQGWVDGTIRRRGLVLKQHGTISNNVLYFYSSSTATANNGKRPYLNITYDIPPSIPDECDIPEGVVDPCAVIESDDVISDDPAVDEDVTLPASFSTGEIAVSYMKSGTEVFYSPPPQGASDTWWDGVCTDGESRYTKVKDYPRDKDHPRMERDYARMYCGKKERNDETPLSEAPFGIRHIRVPKHISQFGKLASWQGSTWGHFMHWTIWHTLENPEIRVDQSATRFCYQGRFKFENLNGEEVFRRVVVILGKTGVRIMTSFPRTSSYCQGISF